MESREAAPAGKPSTHDLSSFGLRDMIECGRVIRECAASATSMQQAAETLVRSFYDTLASSEADPNTGRGANNCVLVRCFKTHRLHALPAPLQAKALRSLAAARQDANENQTSPPEDVPCLTLLATAGDQPEWNDVARSSGHAVIPLKSAEDIQRAPMIAQLVRQLGIEIELVMHPHEELLIEADEKAYGVFHVEHAQGSEMIPAQREFVLKYGIESVLGFGGILPSGDLFAVILFTRVPVRRETATLFRTLALSVKLALLPFTRGPIFLDDPMPDLGSPTRSFEQEQTRSEAATLRLLIPALEAAALYQTARLENVIADLQVQKEQFARLGTRLSNMLESTTDAVFLLDREWRFTYLNQRAYTLLQVDQTLLGTTIWAQFPNAGSSSFGRNYRQAMDEGKPVHFEEHLPDMLDRWFEIHAFPSEQGLAVFLHDVTDRKLAEAALMKHEKLAAVGRLAASIAHEINNPLESVTNLLYLARSSQVFADVQDYLATADRELRRVGAITNQTLRFHKQSTNPTEVDGEDLLDGVFSIYHGRVVNSRVQVEKQQRAKRPVLCFDGEIRQVLNNLVGNAIDAMHPDGGRLLLRSRDAVDWRTGRSGMALTVADTGPGMSVQTLIKAREPFFTTKGIGGTGLGLWVSQEIVARHEGRMSLRSSQMPGRNGTVVTVFLPHEAAIR